MRIRKNIRKFVLLATGCFLLSAAAISWTDAPVCGKAAKKIESVSIESGKQPQATQAMATVHYPPQQPASLRPMLRWSKVDGAVAYELEILQEAPEDPARFAAPLFSTKQIYVNGYNADLSQSAALSYLYWRVRGLDIEGKAIGPFSTAEKIYIDRKKAFVQSPVPTSIFNKSTGAALLYPVYAWIPIHGASTYEVEILDAPPENPGGIEPSRHRIDAAIAKGFDYYDDTARISEKTLYWRVRGLDQDGNPVGLYSAAEAFNIDLKQPAPIATYGDSITHGGGDLSYSPADWEYSYQHYLDFPTINLAQSGDTSESMVARFERDVVPFRPEYLLILAGTNSLRGGASAESVIADLAALREKCLAHQIQPIFLTLPPIHPKHIERAFNQSTAPTWKRKIARVNQFIRTQNHIETARFLDDGSGLLAARFGVDGLHPGPAGKQRMAAAINAHWKEVTRRRL